MATVGVVVGVGVGVGDARSEPATSISCTVNGSISSSNVLLVPAMPRHRRDSGASAVDVVSITRNGRANSKPPSRSQPLLSSHHFVAWARHEAATARDGHERTSNRIRPWSNAKSVTARTYRNIGVDNESAAKKGKRVQHLQD